MEAEDEECPETFFKYRGLDGDSLAFVERTICHNEIYYPAPGTFNDPFDCYPTYDFDATADEKLPALYRGVSRLLPLLTEEQRMREAKRIAQLPTGSAESQKYSTHMQQQQDELIRQQIGVLCVSTNPNSMLMWAHYARSHTGICLQFDGMSDTYYFGNAQKVHYPKQRQPIRVFRDNDNDKLDKALFNKAEDWKYEDEWRIVNYQDGPGVYTFPPEILTGVILGARTTQHHESLIRKWIQQRTHPTKVYRARPSGSTFEIHIDPA